MEGENQNANTDVNGAGANNATDNNQNNQAQTFDDILSNKEYQAEFDRRVQKARQEIVCNIRHTRRILSWATSSAIQKEIWYYRGCYR